MTAWEKPVPHHKLADEVKEEKRVKDALKTAKKEAKAEDHSKVCPFCGHKPVQVLNHPSPASPGDEDHYKDNYECPGCERLYRVKCPGTTLLDGNPVIVEYGGR